MLAAYSLRSDETSAIELAKEYLVECLPEVAANSEVNAECIAGAKRGKQLQELQSFTLMQVGKVDGLSKRFGLDEDHWLVRFFVIYPEGTAGTIPPTMGRVYESDSRVEVALKD